MLLQAGKLAGIAQAMPYQPPPELAALYPYDADQAAAHEQKIAVANTRHRDQTRETIYTGLLRREQRLQVGLTVLQDTIVELQSELVIFAVKARGHKPWSPERVEFNHGCDRKLALVRQVRAVEIELRQVRAQMAEYR